MGFHICYITLHSQWFLACDVNKTKYNYIYTYSQSTNVHTANQYKDA